MDIKGDVEIKDLLPLGSVVTIKDSNDYRVMITGYFPISKGYDFIADTTGETCPIFDYMGMDWHETPSDKVGKILFNHEKIDKVLFRGYVNEESNAIKILLEEHFKKEQ